MIWQLLINELKKIENKTQKTKNQNERQRDRLNVNTRVALVAQW